MTDDRLRRVLDCLALARSSLEVSEERTGTLSGRLDTVYRDIAGGDPYTAQYALRTIISDLGELKTRPPGVVQGAAKLTQKVEWVLYPGVAEAIKQLKSALEILEANFGLKE